MIEEIGVESGVDGARRPSGVRPPAAALWLLRATAPLAPPGSREEWNTRWSSRLWNLWILVERGELAGRAATQTAALCRDAIAAAFWMRFDPGGFRQWQRGPWCVLSLGLAALAVLALVSRGFASTRQVILTTIEWKVDKIAPKLIRYDPRGDVVVGHLVPLVMALLVGAVVVFLGGRYLGRCGWKYWLYLAAKLVLLTLVVPLGWIEGNGLLRAHLERGTLQFASVLAFALTFFGVYGCSVIWVFADQRRRCPVCLGRLALPVTFGSWASIFEPVTTEMICGEGHGSMTVAESEIAGDDRWIELDETWRF
jgi:hypothetical protein